MKNPYCWFMLIVLVILPCRETLAAATNRYVATNVSASAWPFDSWTTAATNIKDAVDAANANNAGDIVYVSNGTYRVSAQINVTNCVVTNVNADPDLVVVAGNYPATTNRIFYLNHSNAAIYGMTITNGYEITSGGGLYVENGNIYRCLITGNCATNTTSSYGGGGVFMKHGVMADCTIVNNTVNCTVVTYVGGGGVFLRQAGIATVRGCLIERNLAAGTAIGGGMLVYYGSGVQTGIVENCSIISNQTLSTWGGGGIYVYGGGSLCTIRNCLITGNLATNGVYPQGNGGGMILNSSGAVARNCLITLNTSRSFGGGITTGGSKVEGCTIVSNTSILSCGGGISCGNSAKSNVSNCIIYYNIGKNLDASGGACDYTSVCYSCTSAGSGFTIEGVVTAAPLFQNMASNDFRLTRGSPCINAGLNQAWMEDELDLDAHARIDRFSGRVDMGAYEFVPAGTMFGMR